MADARKKPLVGVLSIQGAFEEHQACLEASGCRTKQVSSSTQCSVVICWSVDEDSPVYET
jgi:hypothetical protein